MAMCSSVQNREIKNFKRRIPAPIYGQSVGLVILLDWPQSHIWNPECTKRCVVTVYHSPFLAYRAASVPTLLWILLETLFEFIFWPRHAACGILVLWAGSKPVLPALEAWNLNHWTAGGVLRDAFLIVVLNIHSKSQFLPLASFPCGATWRSFHILVWRAVRPSA